MALIWTAIMRVGAHYDRLFVMQEAAMKYCHERAASDNGG